MLNVNNKDKQDEQIFQEQLAPFAIVEEALKKSNEESKAILERITETNDEFNRTKQTSHALRAKEAVIQDLNLGLNAFNRLLANSNEGVNFYSNLMKQKIDPLSQRVEDFVFARDMEKRMILDQLTKSLAGYGEDDKSGDVRPRGGSASNPNMSFEGGGMYGTISSAPPPTTSTTTQRLEPPYFPTAPSSNSYGAPSTGLYQQQPLQQQQQQPSTNPFSPSFQPQSSPYNPSSSPSSFPTPQKSQTDTSGTWACGACTYVNPPTASVCSVCSTPRAIVPVVQPQPKKRGWFG